jgi:hypothetical protein
MRGAEAGGRYAASNEAIDFGVSYFAAVSRGEMEKERETKDDGRYIIFYTFEDEETKPPSEEEGAAS